MKTMERLPVTVLDGGMGRELKRVGAPFRQPEWSALALIEAPDFVSRVHEAFVAAGADVLTTNSYALVPFHIGEDRFARDGARLADLSGRLAREVAGRAPRPVRVAGSLPPLFGSYRPDLFEPARAPALLATLIEALSPHVDLWLAETQSSLAESAAVKKALGADARPLWLSFTLEDEADDAEARPRLRSGESIAAATEQAVAFGASALLFNCSQPEVIAPALREARRVIAAAGASLPLGAYANAFPAQKKTATANATLLGLRDDLSPTQYLTWANRFAAEGATLIGGCCGIGPDHIACLASRFGRTPSGVEQLRP